MILNMSGGGGSYLKYTRKYKTTDIDQLFTVAIDGVFEYPTVIDGSLVSQTLKIYPNIQGVPNGNQEVPFRIYRKIIVPDYFTTFDFGGLPLAGKNQYMVRDLTIKSNNITWPGWNYGFWHHEQFLNRIECTNWQTQFDPDVGDAPNANYWEDPISFIMPKATALGGRWYGDVGHLVGIEELDFPAATRVGGKNGNYYFNRYWKTGSWVFPACTTIIQIEQGEEEQTMRFPKLTTCNNTNMFRQDWSHGKFIWCIGKDLATLASQIATNINNAAGQIEVHIPAGASTTLTTLQNAGVNSQYIFHDYGTESLYPEDAQYFS